MTGSGSDIRAVLSLDDFEYIHGLERSSKATKKFAGDARQLAGGGGGRGALIGRGITQAGYALQDFSSVLGQGGKGALGRAMGSMMNNFQMLGQGMGAFGGAAFAVAGGIGSVVIPKLLEGGTAFEKIGEEIKETTARLDKFIERENRMTDFEAKLGKVDTRRGLREAGEHNALDIKKKDDELQIVKDRYQQLAFERQKLGASRNATGAGQNFLESWSSPTKLLGMATSSIMGIDGAIKIVDDDMKKMLTHILDSAADLAQLRKQEEAIEAAGGRVDSRNFDILKGLESDPGLGPRAYDEKPGMSHLDPQVAIARSKKELEQLKQVEDSVRSPFEKAQRDIARLAELKSSDVIDDDLFQKGGRKVVKDFGLTQHATPVNAGVGGIAGRDSSAWYQAIQDSKRSTMNPEDREKIELLKKQIEEAKKQTRQLERISDGVRGGADYVSFDSLLSGGRGVA